MLLAPSLVLHDTSFRDVGATAVVLVVSVAAAAKHEVASVLKQVNGTAAACCPTAAAAALPSLYIVSEGTKFERQLQSTN